MMLKSKHAATNAEFQFVYDHYRAAITADDVETVAAATVKRIRETISGLNAGYGYSGGKDSIVLAHLLRRATGKDLPCVLCVTNELEFPSFMEFVEKHGPRKMSVFRSGHTLEWLACHRSMLFPSSANMTRWMNDKTWAGQKRFTASKRIEVFMTGRRKADNNFTGRHGGLYWKNGEMIQFNPLADWTHEQTIGYIRYNNLPLPSYYAGPRGWTEGSCSWPTRSPLASVADNWAEIHAIDPPVVEFAATKIPSARKYLETVA